MTTAQTGSEPLSTLVCVDLEGTLCRGRHLWAAVVGDRFPHAFRAPRVAGYVLYIAAKSFAVRVLSWGAASQLTRDGIYGMASLLRGMNGDAAEALFQRAACVMVSDARPSVVAAVREHQEAGHAVLMISATFQPMVEQVARRLGIPHALGTALEMSEQRYTGRLAGEPLVGKSKVQMVGRYVVSRGWRIDWSQSYAYADREPDVPLLESVGHPVAVHPDRTLRAVARSRGWAVFE